MEEWNENIEQILEQKDFAALTEEDFEVLGEIAQDQETYDNYRSLMVNVIPAVKSESIQPSATLEDRIASITDKEDKGGAGYYTWMRYAAVAAVLVLLFSGAYWIISRDSINDQSEEGIAQNESAKKSDRKVDNTEMDQENQDQDASFKKTTPIEQKNQELSTSEDDETLKDTKKEETKSLDNDAPQEDVLDAVDETMTMSPNAEPFESLREGDGYGTGVYQEDADESFAADYEESAEEEIQDVASGNVYNAQQNKRKLAASSAKEAPVESDNLRNDIVGTLKMAKPASEDENAFDVLTVAY